MPSRVRPSPASRTTDRLARYAQAPPFELTVHSWDIASTKGVGDCEDWIVYEMEEAGVCVEPWTALPNSLNMRALDAERKPTLHRGFRQSGGHERKGQRHSDRALAFVLADGERLDGLGGIDQEFVEPAVSVAQCFDETVSRLRSHCS